MKHLLNTLIILFGTTVAFSQNVGVKGGWSLSNLSSSDGQIEDVNARNGFTIGVFSRYDYDLIGFQAELLYTQKGSSYESSLFDVEVESNYLELPLTMHLNLLEPFYIYAGPQFSYLMNSQVRYSALNGSDVVNDNDESNYNRLDVGGVVGVGFRCTDHVAIDARVSKGYIDFDEDRTFGDVVEESQNLKNFNFQLTTAISF